MKSVPGKLLKIDIEPIEAVRLLSAFGTAELSFASLMLSGVINVACDKRKPESARINEALAAVTGIGAGDEIEGMRYRGKGQQKVTVEQSGHSRYGAPRANARDANGYNASRCDERFAPAQGLGECRSAGTAGIDAKAGAVDLACRRGNIALEERTQTRLLMVGNIRSRRIWQIEISAAQASSFLSSGRCS